MVFQSLMAQTPADDFLPLYPEGKIPNAKDTHAESIQETSELGSDGIERISGVRIPTMRYYPAEKQKSTGSAIIICPGGGYSILAISHEGHDVAKKFAENGIAAFVLKYRLPNDLTMEDKSIGPLQDVQQALKVIRENASAYAIDPEKLGVIGFSAGGHLASSAGTHYSDPKIENLKGTSLRPNFMLLIYPVISMDTAVTHGGSRKNLLGENPDKSLASYFSSAKHITTNTPPTLLVHAADDTAVPIANSIDFYENLQKEKVPSKLIRYPQGGHGFGLHNKTTDDQWFDHALAWLHQLGY
ncbi:alpha/beta hydrolase [Olivibacter sp. SDN3]|nr:alpha/beta hydrolase [Olivibacter sp. SDN3]